MLKVLFRLEQYLLLQVLLHKDMLQLDILEELKKVLLHKDMLLPDTFTLMEKVLLHRDTLPREEFMLIADQLRKGTPLLVISMPLDKVLLHKDIQKAEIL
ncbi:MAG: hypothetical protein DRI61_11435 [Chloroflexi bacterium]|nr:MAG: hypothetical protein DRI61_11435 [Chloroflexota bacterium]